MTMKWKGSVGLGLLTCGLATGVWALDGSWAVDAGGSWTNDANWGSLQIADGAGYTATFNRTFTGSPTVTIHKDQTIGNLVFGADGYINLMANNSSFLISGSPKELTLNNGVSIPAVTCWQLAPVNSACRISVSIVSPLGFIKNGNGTLWLNAANPKLGGTIELRQGRIFAQTAGSCFGTASVVVSNGCYISFWSGGTFTNAFALHGIGRSIEGQQKWTLTADNTPDLTLSGPIQLNASSELAAISGRAMTVSGQVSGSGTLIAAGAGKVTLSGVPKDFTGGIVVSNTCVLAFGASTNCLGMPSNKTNLITVLPGAAIDLANRSMNTYYPANQGYTITASGYGSNPSFTGTYGAIYGAIVNTGSNDSNQGMPNLRMVGDTWIGNNSSKFYYNGQVSGPYSLIKVGDGVLVSQGSFADDMKALIISNGTFVSIQRMGKVDVSVYSNATLSLYTENALTNKLSLLGGALLKNDGSRSPRLYGDVIVKDVSTIRVTDPAKTLTIYGNISGDGSFKKIDTGKLLLTGTNTFSGRLWVTNGVVQVNSTNSLPVTADVYLYTASSNGSTPIAQLNLNYNGTRAVRRFYIDDELQTRNKIYHSANSKLTLTGTGMICPTEGTNPKGLLIRFF